MGRSTQALVSYYLEKQSEKTASAGEVNALVSCSSGYLPSQLW